MQRDASGRISHAYTYACLGKILGKEKFSFNLLSRTHDLDQQHIEELVDVATSKVKMGAMDLSGMRYNDAAAYTKCGY